MLSWTRPMWNCCYPISPWRAEVDGRGRLCDDRGRRLGGGFENCRLAVTTAWESLARLRMQNLGRKAWNK
jgi:hypothetical protein